MLTTEQKQTFAEEGYLVFKDLLPKTLIEEVLDTAKTVGTQESFTYEEGILKFWDTSVILRYPAFTKIAEFPAWEELRESIGSDFRLRTDKLSTGLVFCPSGEGLFEWHQDSAYNSLPELYPNHAIALIYLQDSTSLAVGPMKTLAGSHKSDYQFNYSSTVETIDGEINLAFPSGTAIIFHEDLWHKYGPNLSGTDQWTLYLHYARPKAI